MMQRASTTMLFLLLGLAICLFSVNNAKAQIVQDQTEDFNFYNYSLSDLLKIKQNFDGEYNPLVDTLLKKKGLKCLLSNTLISYIDTAHDISLSYGSQKSLKLESPFFGCAIDQDVLVLSTNSKTVNVLLREFAREQKWNENLYYDYLFDSTSEVTKFYDLQNKLKLFVYISDKSSFLIIN
ncbi:hypothetical protein J2W55_002796 [Mucilaginibacter pocheonensis]|uniref:Uncharacterized protein n=1 Tax=Mucilaginibacter pocheonensis TaxID=398050 RepID=A0ABU1TC38_9SPHI|nr:hypothetical protein [Mucilaginibacter pocheonensis]